MRDKTISKVVFRLINLLIYIIYLSTIVICALTEIHKEFDIVEKNRLFTYRFTDTIVRLFCTFPVSIAISYYIIEFSTLGEIFNLLAGILVFIILNFTIRLGMQEAFQTGYVINDSL